MKKRTFMHTAAALALASALPVAHAQSTPIKFQLDWRFEGPAALFLQPVAKGHFKAAGLDVTVDAGNGSGGAVQRVASGTYDMGFADLAAVMEFHANNPDAQNKPVAVMMVYNNTPASVMALKKSGITKPADLAGKKLGAPVFDAGRRAFPIFQKANGIGAVQRVASGTYDMGFADLAAVMEFHANNPDAQNKPVAVMMVYNNTPASVIALKKSGITKPADLTGKKLGAPVFDAGRRAFPIFQKANGIGAVQWTAMDPPLRETMLVRGDVDAITGFTFTSLLNLEARGAKASDVLVLPYADFGVKLYGNVIIASPKLIKENPAAIKAFLSAFTKGAKEVIANPAAAIEHVKARDGIVNVPLETRRLQLAIDTVINSPDARAEGFGQAQPGRLALMASQVSDAFNTKTRVNADHVWNASFLPSAAELNILPKK